MSLHSWFTRNNLKTLKLWKDIASAGIPNVEKQTDKETLAKYWNPIPLSIDAKPTERSAPNFRLQGSVVNLDDYGDKFLNEIGEKYE